MIDSNREQLIIAARLLRPLLGERAISSDSLLVSSRGLLATDLPLLPRRFQLPVPLGCPANVEPGRADVPVSPKEKASPFGYSTMILDGACAARRPPKEDYPCPGVSSRRTRPRFSRP